jgi:cyclophilin family peptidyl-prolyl cis-trans isomerase
MLADWALPYRVPLQELVQSMGLLAAQQDMSRRLKQIDDSINDTRYSCGVRKRLPGIMNQIIKPRFFPISVGRFAAFLIVAASPALILGQDADRSDQPVKAMIGASKRHFRTGEPVYALFKLCNTTDKEQELRVPELKSDGDLSETGLPLSHVFSGVNLGGVTVRSAQGRSAEMPMNYQVPIAAPVIKLAPRACLGVEVDLTRYFNFLRTPGEYQIRWMPYGGTLESPPLFIKVQPLKHAIISTDVGIMTVRFFYEDAPNHIDNFIELAQDGFYDGLTFHYIEPSYYILGGSPRGDGMGIRPDGKKLNAEFNDQPVDRGAVVMGRLENDPDSASCQFFICNTSLPEWQGFYTVFGHLVDGESYQTLDKLMTTETDESNRPLRSVFIRSINIVDVPGDSRYTTLGR